MNPAGYDLLNNQTNWFIGNHIHTSMLIIE